jgi:hypothetical protein
MRRVLFRGGLGALVALPLDALHVASGVLSYRTPRLPGGLQDWWAVPLFVGAGVALGMAHRHMAMPLARARELPPASLAAALAGLAAFVFAYASSNVLQAWPALALASYVVVWGVALLLVERAARVPLALHSLGAALAGRWWRSPSRRRARSRTHGPTSSASLSGCPASI